MHFASRRCRQARPCVATSERREARVEFRHTDLGRVPSYQPEGDARRPLDREQWEWGLDWWWPWRISAPRQRRLAGSSGKREVHWRRPHAGSWIGTPKNCAHSYRCVPLRYIFRLFGLVNLYVPLRTIMISANRAAIALFKRITLGYTESIVSRSRDQS